MKILFLDSNHPSLYQELEKAGYSGEHDYVSSKEEIENKVASYQGIVIRSRFKIDKTFIDKATGLKFIARVGAGMENIDVEYAESKNILCLHAPEGNRDAVGEHTMAMLLALFNNIVKADREVREGKWMREDNRGEELAGKTVGIIGYGNMGSAFAQRLSGFNVKVIAYDKYKKDFGNSQVQEVTMQTIFEQSDVLSLHIPLTEETRYLVNDDFFSKFKKDIYFINTARGKILKTDDLVKNMKAGKVKGACLDVSEYEGDSFESMKSNSSNSSFEYLSKSDKVVLTPHIAGWTFQSNEKMARVLVEKILCL